VWYSKPYIPAQSVTKSPHYPIETSLWQKLTANLVQSLNLSSKRVKVNLAEQKVRTFEENVQINEFTVSSDKPDMPTPKGNFKVFTKKVMVYSNLADCWLPF